MFHPRIISQSASSSPQSVNPSPSYRDLALSSSTIYHLDLEKEVYEIISIVSHNIHQHIERDFLYSFNHTPDKDKTCLSSQSSSLVPSWHLGPSPGTKVVKIILYTKHLWLLTQHSDVHQQIGHSAEHFLTTTTKSVLYQILEPIYNNSIGLAAAWADDYAHTTQGAFSYQWHWIDSADQPPHYCNVYYHRDCSEGGCVVSAIANQTQILRDCIRKVKNGELVGGEDLHCSYALKWVVHFLGDIAQPLHASGIAAGGNGIEVVFANQTTELHAVRLTVLFVSLSSFSFLKLTRVPRLQVWDGWIVYADANVTSFLNTTIQPFFKDLVSRIQEDDFSVPSSEWIACSDPSRPVECALSWARDSNALNCDYVYAHAIDDVDLATSGYATGAFPIVELQMGKAILRIATWLNRLVAGDHHDTKGVVLQTEPDLLPVPGLDSNE